MYNRDSPPSGDACDNCQTPSATIYRCQTCLTTRNFCSPCLLFAHQHQPAHCVERLDQSIWVETSLAELGYVLRLGHNQSVCSQNNNTSKILIGDVNGFFSTSVQYCTHPDAPSKALQLLAVGLFPCSDIHPQSAFTIPFLDIYNVFLTHGRTSANKYYSVLERITKPGFPEDTKDKYRELMFTHRKFLHLKNLQRAGHGFDRHVNDGPPGDQALDCIACPRPGVNFQWHEVAENEEPWFRAFLSYDGNFRSVRKSKKVDQGDISLSDGKAYFSAKQAYKDWTEAQTQPQRTEKPLCDNHKAGNDTSVRFVGQDVTGVGLLSCTSHSCVIPRGIVDFYKGERFIYTDYALASSVAYLTGYGPLKFGLTYDVMCHWAVNFEQRAQNLPPLLALPGNFHRDFVGGIPKWHLVGHAPSCYARWSLDNTQYVGRMEGEGPERIWSHFNEHSGSTSEQGPGVRTDTINNMAYEWNFEKMIRMASQLVARFKEAKRMYQRQKSAHLELTTSLPHERITEWEKVSLEPVQGPGKKWTSPLMDPVWTDGQFQSVIRTGSDQESPTSRVARKRPGATRWLSNAIELEHNMRRIHNEAGELGPNLTPRQAESLNAQRMNLHDRLTQHFNRRSYYMSVLVEQDSDHPSYAPLIDDEPEHTDLGLPSAFASDTISEAGLTSLADLEKDLRRGMCNDVLDSLRQILGARAFALNYKKRHIRGEMATTRAEAGLRAHSAKISQARWRYDNSRDALIRLGASASDLHMYQAITADDLRSLKSYLEDHSRGIGQGYASISWIWYRSITADVDEWQVNALRTEWFRSRERYKRWEEQLFLVKREMTMTIRTFRKREEIWEWKAESDRATPGMRGYALKQSRFFSELALRALRAFKTDLEDDIVTLKWSTAWLNENVNEYGFA